MKVNTISKTMLAILIASGIALTLLIWKQVYDAGFADPGWSYTRASVIEGLFMFLFIILGINIGLRIAQALSREEK